MRCNGPQYLVSDPCVGVHEDEQWGVAGKNVTSWRDVVGGMAAGLPDRVVGPGKIWSLRREVRDAQRQGIHHLLVIPCLLATLMAGPAGLALYWLLRVLVGFVKQRQLNQGQDSL